MQIINENKRLYKPITTAIFDFDGTISSLRAGWESIMELLMLEVISPKEPPTAALIQEVKSYIDESTGIQTAYQMQWLADRVKSYGQSTELHDLWWYKDLYNKHLIQMVNDRIEAMNQGCAKAEDFLIGGSIDFLKMLHEKGICIYIASGTDDVDLQNEICVLGVSDYVTMAKGAPQRTFNCSKEAVMTQLLDEVSADELAVFGDGRVEIALGKERDAVTIGTATDEEKGFGINEVKCSKLIDAGADVIVGDFSEPHELLQFLGIC